MPMPPPKPSTEGPRDRQATHEMGQIRRALAERGPLTPEELEDVLGARYWEPGRFQRALSLVLADGVAVQDAQGAVQLAP